MTSERLVGKKYRLVERLGEGAFGAVYRAIHVGLEKSFAIKLLKTAGPPSSAALERFRREAVALGRLRHPNIVEVTDFGIDGSDSGRPYIVTEILEGRPLSDLCRDHGPLPLAKALPLLEQIAAAVDSAHDAGLLHRDLKPSNVFVCSESPDSPIVKVLDFGLAKLLEGPDPSRDGTSLFGEESLPGITATGSLVGTPLYLAPELVLLGTASRSSDIYSFGVLAYEMLGGKPPFHGSLEEVLVSHLKAEPPLLPLPPEVWRALRAALQKDPTRRPGTAGEIVRRFRKGMVEASKPISTVARAEQRTRKQVPESRSYFLEIATLLFCMAIIGILGFVIGSAPFGDAPVAKHPSESNDARPGWPVEVQKIAVPLAGSSWRPPEPPTFTAPNPLKGTSGFNNIGCNGAIGCVEMGQQRIESPDYGVKPFLPSPPQPFMPPTLPGQMLPRR